MKRLRRLSIIVAILGCRSGWTDLGPALADNLGNHPVETSGSQSNYEFLYDKSPSSKERVAASTVGLIALIIDQEPNPECTGFLIASDKVLTARHCLYDDGKPPSKLNLSGGVQFWLDYYQFGKPYVTFDIDWANIKEGKDDVDYAILPLMKAVPLDGRHIPSLGADPGPDQDLEIVQSRDARPLEFVRRHCNTTDGEDPSLPAIFFKHICDTKPSSSGSPIYDQDWNLIGIHVRGGKSDLVGTANVGLKLSSVVAVESEVGALLSVDHAKPPRQEVAVGQVIFKFDDGRYITKDIGGWLLRSKDTEKAKLVLQSGSNLDTEVVFWLSSDDSYLKIPGVGGRVTQKSAKGTQWTDYGYATRN